MKINAENISCGRIEISDLTASVEKLEFYRRDLDTYSDKFTFGCVPVIKLKFEEEIPYIIHINGYSISPKHMCYIHFKFATPNNLWQIKPAIGKIITGVHEQMHSVDTHGNITTSDVLIRMTMSFSNPDDITAIAASEKVISDMINASFNYSGYKLDPRTSPFKSVTNPVFKELEQVLMKHQLTTDPNEFAHDRVLTHDDAMAVSTGSYDTREKWISECGFVLWDFVSLNELTRIIADDKWLEVMSGRGYLGDNMIEIYGSNIIMTDICDNSYLIDEYSPRTEKIDAVAAIEKYADSIKGVIMSWPPYAHSIGADVLKACIKHNLPLIYIGEGAWGCTADDEFFDIWDEQCDSIHIIPSLLHFKGINDSAWMIMPKGYKEKNELIARAEISKQLKLINENSHYGI